MSSITPTSLGASGTWGTACSCSSPIFLSLYLPTGKIDLIAGVKPVPFVIKLFENVVKCFWGNPKQSMSIGPHPRPSRQHIACQQIPYPPSPSPDRDDFCFGLDVAESRTVEEGANS